jgi:hypothetical protein
MFAYNPQVNDRSGEILGASQTNAAETRAQGMANMGQSIGEGLESMGSSIAGVMEKAAENRIASDGVNAKFDMLKDFKKTNGQPLITQETIDKFDTMPLGKRQAIVSTAESFMDYDLKQWMVNTQMSRVNANMLAQQPAPNQVPMSTNTVPAAQTQANPAPAPAQDWRSLVKPRQ